MCVCGGLEVVAAVAVAGAVAGYRRHKAAPKVIPNPGSDEALDAGCQCPVMDNGHGFGSGWGPGKFWINADCPLHGKGDR